MKRSLSLLILLLFVQSSLCQSDRGLVGRRRDAISNWIRRIRSSKRGYSLSPSWNGKSPYHVPSVASLPLQSEPDNAIRSSSVPVRRFKRKRVQQQLLGPKFPPNYDELNFDGFGEDLELTDFEGNPLKTADFHPDVDDGGPPSHSDPYPSFDSGFEDGGFKENYPFPTVPPPPIQSTPKPTEAPLEVVKYPYRNQQEIVLHEQESNKVVPRRPSIYKQNGGGFKPSNPYKSEQHYPYPPYPNYEPPPRSTPPPRHHNFRFTPHVNYRQPIGGGGGQFDHYSSPGGGYRGGGHSEGGGDSFFDTFDAFGPTGERRVYNGGRRKPQHYDSDLKERYFRKNALRRRFKKPPQRGSSTNGLVPILTPKEQPFYPTVSSTTTSSTTSSSPTTSRYMTTSTTTASTFSTTAGYRRDSTTTRPIPTPGPFDFPPPPPQRASRPRQHPTHPPIITHPPQIRRMNDYFGSQGSNSFTNFDDFDTRFESMKIRNKRNSEYYEYDYDEGATQSSDRRFDKIGTDFWSDANIEYDYFDKPSSSSSSSSSDGQDEAQGDDSYRTHHSVYPSSNYGGYSPSSKGGGSGFTTYTKKSNGFNSNSNNNYNTYFTVNDLPSTQEKALLGSGNFEVLSGGIFDDFNNRRSYSSGGTYTTSSGVGGNNYSYSNRRNSYNPYDMDPAIRFANFKDFATIKQRRY